MKLDLEPEIALQQAFCQFTSILSENGDPVASGRDLIHTGLLPGP